MTCAPSRTPSSRYVRAFLSKQNALNLSRLPKLPEGTPPLISRRSTPGDYDWSITSNRTLKAIDNDFARAVRLEALAEKKIGGMSGEKSSRSVARFPSVHTPSLAIRMIPQKLLVPKEQEPSPILSKNPRKERSDLSLKLITPKASVHRFAVVRVRVRRRVLSALDLIVRRGAAPPPRRQPKQPDKPDPEKPRILLQDPVLANHRSWVLPYWTYIIFPKPEVFRMPLSDLVDDLRLGLRQANQRAKIWQDQYVSPETGGFIPLLSKSPQNPDPSSTPKSWKPKEFRSRERDGKTVTVKLFRGSLSGPPRYNGRSPRGSSES